jgi:hypothetical protein
VKWINVERYGTVTKLEEEPKETPMNCDVVANDQPRQKTQLAASDSKSNSSAMDLSPSSCTHTVGNPS